MKASNQIQRGFTLVEIAIVLLIVSILLGYTVAMFPRQQELKQYRAADVEMDRVIEAIIGFAQVNGRLPCPAMPGSGGFSPPGAGGGANCGAANIFYAGFVPLNTLGITGRVNADNLMLDPWGNPYRYYVSFTDATGSGDVGEHDFVWGQQEMREVGIGDADADGYTDLDGQFIICDDNGADLSDNCNGATEVFGNFQAGPPARYAGAPFVLLSMGKNWSNVPINDELENRGGALMFTDLAIPVGPSGTDYLIKDVAAGQTTFVRRPTGFSEDDANPFDDIVRWVAPNVLFSKLIDADQLP